jgi:hypothetical protein
MTCTYPRNDQRRPECGREAVCEYRQGEARMPRCAVHDSALARLLADEMGMTRLPVVRAGDPMTVSA